MKKKEVRRSSPDSVLLQMNDSKFTCLEKHFLVHIVVSFTLFVFIDTVSLCSSQVVFGVGVSVYVCHKVKEHHK